MSVSGVLVIAMAVLYACGIFLLLERSMTRVLIGFLLLGNATNILILIVAGRIGVAPIVTDGVTAAEMQDPLPQALSLTAIVITFGISAFLLALIYRSWFLGRMDEVEDDEEDIAVGTRKFAFEDEQSDPDHAVDSDFDPGELEEEQLEAERSVAHSVDTGQISGIGPEIAGEKSALIATAVRSDPGVEPGESAGAEPGSGQNSAPEPDGEPDTGPDTAPDAESDRGGRR